jgi:hypothetical protein
MRYVPPRPQPRQQTEWVPCRTCTDGEVWRVAGNLNDEYCPRCTAKRDAHRKRDYDR